MTHSLLPRIRIYLFAALAIFLFPLFSLCAARRRAENADEKKPRILVIPQLTRIGDVICATPVFRAIKEKYPQCFLSVLVTPKTAPILKNNPHIDHLLVFEIDEYREFFGLFRFFKKVREKHFNWSINIAASTFGTLLSVYGCVPKRVTIIRRRRPFSEALTDWMNHFRIAYQEGEYLPELYLTMLRFLGITVPSEIRKEVFTTSAGDKKTETFLHGCAIAPEDIVVGMSVSAGNSVKEWGLLKFEELAEELLKRYRIKLVFIGTAADRKKIESVNTHIKNAGANAAGEFSLEELPSLMKCFSIFVAADSGPIHVADALGVPLIDIVGPVDPYEQTPRGPTSIVVQPPADITPTIFAFRPTGDLLESRRATDAISVRQVLSAFENLYRAMYS